MYLLDSGEILTIGSSYRETNTQLGDFVYLSLFSQDGELLKLVEYGGSDYDIVQSVAYQPGVGVFAIVSSRSTDGDFGGQSGMYFHNLLVCFDASLSITWISNLDYEIFFADNQLVADASGIHLLDAFKVHHHFNFQGEEVSTIRIAEGKAGAGLVSSSVFGLVFRVDEHVEFYRDGKLVFSLDNNLGRITRIMDFSNGFLVISSRITGDLPTPPMISSIWYSTEDVYSFFSIQGELLWQTTVDSTPQAFYDYSDTSQGWPPSLSD
jgi:hypothetical protein